MNPGHLVARNLPKQERSSVLQAANNGRNPIRALKRLIIGLIACSMHLGGFVHLGLQGCLPHISPIPGRARLEI